jgi:uroporphyrinogen decarboxylase
VTRAIARLRRDDVPVILFVNGCAHLLEAMAESGADVLSVDWRVSLSEARRRSGRLALQGNLDPGVLQGPPEKVASRTREMIAETGGRGHIVNLGHGVLPPTPIESVEAFFDTARGASAPARSPSPGAGASAAADTA